MSQPLVSAISLVSILLVAILVVVFLTLADRPAEAWVPISQVEERNPIFSRVVFTLVALFGTLALLIKGPIFWETCTTPTSITAITFLLLGLVCVAVQAYVPLSMSVVWHNVFQIMGFVSLLVWMGIWSIMGLLRGHELNRILGAMWLKTLRLLIFSAALVAAILYGSPLDPRIKISAQYCLVGIIVLFMLSLSNIALFKA